MERDVVERMCHVSEDDALRFLGKVREQTDIDIEVGNSGVALLDVPGTGNLFRAYQTIYQAFVV